MNNSIISKGTAIEIFNTVLNPFSTIDMEALFELDLNYLMYTINAAILDEAINRIDNENEFEAIVEDYPHDGHKFTHIEKDARGTAVAMLIEKGYNVSFSYITEENCEKCIIVIK